MEERRVLVAYGSRHGATAGIAEWVAEGLRAAGLVVDVSPAAAVRSVAPYDAVVLGGALYINRWHGDARSFARRHAAALRERPLWVFSSGPLDSSADERVIPPVPGVAKVVERLGARGHATFGGRLTAETAGFMGRSMAKKLGGDFRNKEAVEAWAHDIGRELATTRTEATLG